MSEEQISVGGQLRAAREAGGLSIEQVSQQLKLARRQVEAIEADAYADLPGNTFTRGFIRNYARLLNLDSAELLAQLETVLPRERAQVAFPLASENPSTLRLDGAKSGSQGWLVGLMVVLGLFIGGGLVFWYLQKPVEPEIAVEVASDIASMPLLIEEASEASAVASEVASTPQASDMASAVAASTPVMASPVASVVASSVPRVVSNTVASPVARVVASVSSAVASKPAQAVLAAKGIRIAVSQDSWVQIVDADEQRIFSGIVLAGTEQAWAGKAPYKLKIGNAPAAKLYYRGKQVDIASAVRGDVATLELK